MSLGAARGLGYAQSARMTPIDTIITLLADRAPGATICPSEAARRLSAEAGSEDWRAMMPSVHAAVDRLVTEGQVRLSWKGQALSARQGAYRIGRGEDE